MARGMMEWINGQVVVVVWLFMVLRRHGRR